MASVQYGRHTLSFERAWFGRRVLKQTGQAGEVVRARKFKNKKNSQLMSTIVSPTARLVDYARESVRS